MSPIRLGIYMDTFMGYVSLMRLERALSAVAGIILTGIIVKDITMIEWNYVIACLAVFFSALANFTLNDYQDIEIDRINKRPDRPLVNGIINPNNALRFTLVSTLIAVILAQQMMPIPRYIIMLGLPASLVYNIYLKKYLIFKNMFTGLANVGVILLGSLVVDNVVEPIAYYIAVIGFFFSISYEIMLDIADVEGDKAMAVDTVPVKFGKKNAAYFSIFIGIFSVLANTLPFFIKVDARLFRDYLFLSLIMIPIINRLLISKNLLHDQSAENIYLLKKKTFKNLQLGGLCYLIGFLY
jgi:4-hydroxybenzoate polyprenyltransferase